MIIMAKIYVIFYSMYESKNEISIAPCVDCLVLDPLRVLGRLCRPEGFVGARDGVHVLTGYGDNPPRTRA